MGRDASKEVSARDRENFRTGKKLTVDVIELLVDSALPDVRTLACNLDHVGRLLLIKLCDPLAGGDLLANDGSPEDRKYTSFRDSRVP